MASPPRPPTPRSASQQDKKPADAAGFALFSPKAAPWQRPPYGLWFNASAMMLVWTTTIVRRNEVVNIERLCYTGRHVRSHDSGDLSRHIPSEEDPPRRA